MILGIDPGFFGGLGILNQSSNQLTFVSSTPIQKVNLKTKIDAEEFAAIVRHYKPLLTGAIIESVHAMPGQGVSSCFNFGYGLGLEVGILTAFGIPIKWVTPQKWKGYFKLGKDKDRSRELAAKLYPNYKDYFKRKKDDGRAEAVLLAHYGGIHGLY